jgi:hypothetical protein
MLHEFSLKNFFSFRDEATVSFCVGEHAPENDLFFRTPSGQRLSRLMAAIGPNASGKTNVLKGLAFLRWFMLMSFRMLEPKRPIPVDRFRFSVDRDEIMAFRLVFEVGGTIYRYVLEMTETRVLKEVLEQRAERNFRYLFKRELNVETGSTDLRGQIPGFDVDSVKGLVRDNCSVLSALAQTENAPLEPVISYLTSMQTNVDRWGRESHTPAEHLSSIFMAAQFYHRNPEYKQQAEDLLAGRLDFGLSGVLIKEERVKSQEKGEPEVVLLPYGVHRVGDTEYRLPMMAESSGTQNSFVLLHQLLPVLSTGGLAVIDEFEADLHPQMIPPILDLFLNPATNPRNAQLFFSTHSIEVLRKLDKTQVILVEKDADCQSQIFRMDEIRGVRRDVDLYAKYMSGAFGAVPNV